MKGRKAGLFAALVLGLGVVALVGWGLLHAGRAQPGGAGAAVDPAQRPNPLIAGSARRGPEGGFENILADSGEGRIELVDERGQVMQEYEYDDLVTLEEGRYRVTNPKAWLYLADGTVVHARAAEGVFAQPPGANSPESGSLEGSVIIEMFPPEAGRAPRGPVEGGDGAFAPWLTITTARLEFDAAAGEVRTKEDVRLSGSGFDGSLPGFVVLVNEPRRQIAYFGSEGPGSISYLRPGEDQAGRGATPPRADAAGRPSSGAAPPTLDHYHLEVLGDVVLSGEEADVRAERLDAWLRLIDRALPEGAVAPIRIADGRSSESRGGGARGPAGGGGSAGSKGIVLGWSNGISLRPLDEAPEQLGAEHVALRLSAPGSGTVAAGERSTGAIARCAAIVYGATTRRLALVGGAGAGVAIAIPEHAELLAPGVEIDLTAGLAAAPGAGTLRALSTEADAEERAIRWQERCDVSINVRDGVILADAGPLVRDAVFSREVEAVAGAGRLTGESVRAVFAQSSAERPVLHRVVVEGDARADAGPDGRLSARRIDVQFEPGTEDEERPTPRLVSAEGAVRAEREGSTLAAELAEATLERTPEGEIGVRSFAARLGVQIRLAGGEEVMADEVRADGVARTADLVGSPVVLRKSTGSLSAASMRLDETAQSVRVFGAGVLNRSEMRQDGLGYERLQVQWQGGMVYEDARGFAEFTGDVVATAEPNDLARDVARAERLVLELDPNVATEGDRPEDSAPALRSARLYGGEVELGDGRMANLESRRYRPDAASATGVALDGVVYVESATIEARGAEEVMLIPQAGRMIVEDRRPAEGETTAALRGSTILEWQGDARVDRKRNIALVKRGVHVRHVAAEGGEPTELECERLDATLLDESASAGATDGRERISLDATGAVYLTNGARQLIADALVYDGATGIAEARAWPGNLVALFDPSLPEPAAGSLLLWDLTRDRVEWRDGAAITVPN